MISIKMIKKTTGKGMIRKFEKAYGSFDGLERIVKKDPENMIAYYDLDDWKYFLKHPNEEVEDGKTIFTEDLSIGKIELEILNFIKNKHPKSMRDLAKLMNKDVGNVQRKVKHLEKEGLITLEEGSKNSKIPIVNYDKIEIEI
ncbi:winged helix-turn-helix transcriptional regulator [Methanobrevibacter sp. TMH8]|uniref:HVO_A0114 family putative DNA-binding protein n=1 Tax=Methanobrevibacter sp. TMH8 TaxID=2848611 RepID=UPI001CCD5E96|nr:MarR family transcriptional regulator [Methanobrevibacter sp. TMH8]MBZ9571059.1 winged helix-turn-helix transcriptional regulator [Methanobrevibacter sp. TMH8]